MKKYSSKIALALVCVLLSFMVTYKFKMLTLEDKGSIENENMEKLKSQIQLISEEKKKLEKSNNEIMIKLKKYEDEAVKQGDLNKDTILELDKARMLLGIRDVQGTGVTFTLTPKASFFNNNLGVAIIDKDLAYIVNELNISGAEAICINNRRITSQSGIRSSSSNSYILVNDEKVSPNAKITIKAIGSKVKLQDSLKKLSTSNYLWISYYDTKIEVSDSILISMYEKKYMTEYIKANIN